MTIMESGRFRLDRRTRCDVISDRGTGEQIVLLPGQLEELARFLSCIVDAIRREEKDHDATVDR